MGLTRISGTVSAVMECWPLELKIQTASDPCIDIVLSENCKITRSEVVTKPCAILIGDQVAISVEAEHPTIAIMLEIL